MSCGSRIAGTLSGLLEIRMVRTAPLVALGTVMMVALVSPGLAEPRAVIELFTSQGCSSCPAADKLAGKLATDPSLVVFAGKEYGTGSSRDWAAKGAMLLGIRAVVAQSFERIHRSNLVGMGVLPLVFEEGTSWQTLGMKGDEQVTIRGVHDVKPRQRMIAEIVASDGGLKRVPLICRIDTLDELDYFKNGGILHYVLRHLAA